MTSAGSGRRCGGAGRAGREQGASRRQEPRGRTALRARGSGRAGPGGREGAAGRPVTPAHSALRSVSRKTPPPQRNRLTGLAQRPECSSALREASEATEPTTAALPALGPHERRASAAGGLGSTPLAPAHTGEAPVPPGTKHLTSSHRLCDSTGNTGDRESVKCWGKRRTAPRASGVASEDPQSPGERPVAQAGSGRQGDRPAHSAAPPARFQHLHEVSTETSA